MRLTKLLILAIWGCFSQLSAQCVLPPDFLGQQQIHCDSFRLGPVAGLSKYVWNNSPSDTFPTFLIHQGGQHFVEGLDSQGNVCRDTVIIIILPSLLITTPPEIPLCGNRYVDLCPSSGPWGGGSFTQYLEYYDSAAMAFVPAPLGKCYFWIDSTSTFMVEITDQNGCKARDTFTFVFNETLKVQTSIYPDFGKGEGAVKAHVILGQPPFEYKWSTLNWLPIDSIGGLNAGTGGRLEVRDATSCTTMVDFAIPYETAVYPGDANHDQKVDMCDLFPIGLHFGKNGPSRPSASISWLPQRAPLWNQSQLNGKDLRHADTDGDGTIGWSDTLAIQLHFDSTHFNQRPVPASGGVPLYFQLSSSQPLLPGDTVTVFVMVARADSQVFNLLGLAADFQLDGWLIESLSEKISFNGNWLGNQGMDLIALKRENQLKRDFDIGMVKNDGRGKSGFGKLAELTFVLQNRPITGPEPIVISWGEAKAIDFQGEEIELNPQNLLFTVSPVMALEKDIFDKISIYPNPARDFLQIDHPGIRLSHLSLYNSLGQEIQLPTKIGLDKSLMRLSELSPGMYWVKGGNGEGFFGRTVILQ